MSTKVEEPLITLPYHVWFWCAVTAAASIIGGLLQRNNLVPAALVDLSVFFTCFVSAWYQRRMDKIEAEGLLRGRLATIRNNEVAHADKMGAMELDRDRSAAAALIGILLLGPENFNKRMLVHLEQYAIVGLRHIARNVMRYGAMGDRDRFEDTLRRLKALDEYLSLEHACCDLNWVVGVHDYKMVAMLEIPIYSHPILDEKLAS